MEPTAESLFEEHLAQHGEAKSDDTSRPEASAFKLLCDQHPEHTEELKRLRGLDLLMKDALPGTVDPGTSDDVKAPAEEDRFATGNVILDRYRIVGLLGRGGMGEVYRADDLTLGQPVALKFLSEQQVWSEELRERFLDEVRLARDVSHPSICRVFDVGDFDGQVFLTMEYVDGEDLTSLLLRVGRLPSEKAIEIARQLCAGLAAVHERGIVHRDLKPGNVMIDGRGSVKIADFGLAGVLKSEDEAAGEIIGTPAYMAPELTEGKGPSVASDIYALGLVLYEIFTGHPAFTGRTHNEYFQAHREQAPKSPSTFVTDLDPAIEEVIDRCLEKSPALRPASALAVSGALPGGDPLAEALARGETPSPEAVAAAGGTGVLRPAVAYTLLAFTAIAFWLLCWALPQVRTSGAVPLDLHPKALEQRAKELLDGPLEYTQSYEEWDWSEVSIVTGFIWASSYINWGDAIERTKGEVERPAGELPAPYYFWMRTSAGPIYSPDALRFVSPTNPPLGHRREAIVFLRPDGDLDRFLAFRGSSTKYSGGRTYEGDLWTPPEPPEPELLKSEELLRASGFDPQDMRPIRPSYWPRVPVDLRLSWQGTAPGEAEGEKTPPQVIVEAGFYEGDPACLMVFDPQPPRDETEVETSSLQSMLVVTRDATTPIMMMTMIVAGAFLMLRNFRQRRGDRPRAARLAWFIVGLTVLRWALDTRYSQGVSLEFWRFAQALGYSMFFGGACWLLYLGLEPHIRKVWPHTLISWTRVLSGRWRDPMVGRDVLVGIMAGISLSLVEPLSALVSRALGSPLLIPFRDTLRPLEYLSTALGEILGNLRFGVVLTLVAFLLLALMRSGLRSRVAAIVLWVTIGAIGIPQAGTFGDPLIDITMGLMKIGIWVFAAVRFGVLTAAVMQSIHMITMDWPLTDQLSAWHATPTLLLIFILGPLAVFVARTSCRGPLGSASRAPAG